jgi:predicted Rdx family selenoprotein
MDENYQTFQKFNDPQLARTIANQLSTLGIPSQIVDENPNFNPSFVTNVVEPTIHLKLRSDDFDRAHGALEEYYRQHLHDVDQDYYLLSFTDRELREIITRPDEWGHFDYALAKQLLAERGLAVTPGEAEDLKQQRIRQLSRPERTHMGWIILGYVCAVFGGLFGFVIGYIFAYTKKTLPDGRTVPLYPHWARHHGKNIFFLSIAGTVLTFLIFIA